MDDLVRILARVEDKKRDYASYQFTPQQDTVLKTFFDLAQEFDTLDDFYRVCVAVPKVYFGLETNLYLLGSRREMLMRVCSSDEGYQGSSEIQQRLPVEAQEEVFLEGASLFVPIYGKMVEFDEEGRERIPAFLGVLEMSPCTECTEGEKFFFQKFANRIGYALSNRILSQKNIEHLKFIESLVADIEHNIIVPNMAFRLFLRRLLAKIRKNQEIESILNELLFELANIGVVDPVRVEQLMAEFKEVNHGLEDEFSNIDSHNRNISLFVESLFRRSHFQEGRYVAQKRSCNLRKEIIDPQLERFRQRFNSRGIEIRDELGDAPEEPVVAVADVGLMSQVYANLFSNALKYARPIDDGEGSSKHFVAFGQETLKDYFGEGKDGIKLNVFSTGPHIPRAEHDHIFSEGYRGSQVEKEPGTGHGLSFIKRAVEIHEGEVGCEPTSDGNNFYFVLPK
jgi:signal transduction histidine kinase